MICFEPTRWFAVAIYFIWLIIGFTIKRLFFVANGREMEDHEVEAVFARMFPLIGRFLGK